MKFAPGGDSKPKRLIVPQTHSMVSGRPARNFRSTATLFAVYEADESSTGDYPIFRFTGMQDNDS
jgi:hypothetical protein